MRVKPQANACIENNVRFRHEKIYVKAILFHVDIFYIKRSQRLENTLLWDTLYCRLLWSLGYINLFTEYLPIPPVYLCIYSLPWSNLILLPVILPKTAMFNAKCQCSFNLVFLCKNSLMKKIPCYQMLISQCGPGELSILFTSQLPNYSIYRRQH